MKLHPRTLVCQDAQRKLNLAWDSIATQLDLTPTERYAVLWRVAADDISGMFKYMIREERHGDAETPGDVE